MLIEELRSILNKYPKIRVEILNQNADECYIETLEHVESLSTDGKCFIDCVFVEGKPGLDVTSAMLRDFLNLPEVKDWMKIDLGSPEIRRAAGRGLPHLCLWVE